MSEKNERRINMKMKYKSTINKKSIEFENDGRYSGSITETEETTLISCEDVKEYNGKNNFHWAAKLMIALISVILISIIRSWLG